MRHPFSKKTITSRFGAIKGRVIPHRGLDYAPKEGTRIPAVSGGTVQVVKWSSILGWVLVQLLHIILAQLHIMLQVLLHIIQALLNICLETFKVP